MNRQGSGPLRPTVFLDRDGTLNIDHGFTHAIGDLEFFPGAVEALAALKAAGYLLIVVTNQSGVARGHFTVAQVDAFHAHMNTELRVHRAEIDAFYYCPYHPDGTVEAFRRETSCRKPAEGMFTQAVADFSVDVPRSFMVGDRSSDIGFGVRAGLFPILVRTGHGMQTEASVSSDVVVTDSFADAAKWILSGGISAGARLLVKEGVEKP